MFFFCSELSCSHFSLVVGCFLLFLSSDWGPISVSGKLYLVFGKNHVKFKRKALEIKAYGRAVRGPESHCKAAEEKESSHRVGLSTGYLIFTFFSLPFPSHFTPVNSVL